MTTPQFNWLLYLDVADHLRRQRREEFYRSAVSRAYYGVFGHIRHTLLRQGVSVSSGRDIHRRIINALRADPRPTVARLGDLLSDLRDERNRADYETNDQFDASRARAALSVARSIQNRMSALFP